MVNDLDDIEKDKINHPERPLPTGQLNPTVVVVLYFVCLGSALLSIRYGVGVNHIAFLYYLLLTMCISYSYVTEYLPSIKAIYVALASMLPILILVAHFPSEIALTRIALAFFLFSLGRELYEDLLDRPGDPVSFLHRVPWRRVATFAFGFQATGLLLMSLQVKNLFGFLNMLLMTALFIASCFYSLRREQWKVATALTKAMMFCGLYFLI